MFNADGHHSSHLLSHLLLNFNSTEVNRKVLMLVRDPEALSAQLQAVLRFFSQNDKVLLAVWREDSQSGWPFRMYDLGWNLLQDANLWKRLSDIPAMKRRPVEKWLESSAFLDLIIVHRQLFDVMNRDEQFGQFINKVSCPVFLMDENQNSFDEIFLSYNGSPASFESIKHFAYLFQDQINTARLNLIIKINETAVNLENCVYDYLRLHKRHFAISRFFEDDYDAGIEHLLEESNSPLVVVGGERRKNFDQFRHFANLHTQPSSLFIL